MDDVIVLDSDTLSELSRGHARVTARARAYLSRHGRFTLTAVSVYERLRGYRAALREGKPFERQVQQFEAFVAASIVLPLDGPAADRAALIWAALDRKHRNALGDILIAAIASARNLPLATRNRRDFEPIAKLESVDLKLVDWTR